MSTVQQETKTKRTDELVAGDTIIGLLGKPIATIQSATPRFAEPTSYVVRMHLIRSDWTDTRMHDAHEPWEVVDTGE